MKDYVTYWKTPENDYRKTIISKLVIQNYLKLHKIPYLFFDTFNNDFREEGMTHKQACYARVNGKSAYINEHQYPLSIVKKALLNDGWTLDQLKDYMYTYGSYTVVTKEEDLKLKSVSTIKEGHNRYENANIEVLKI